MRQHVASDLRQGAGRIDPPARFLPNPADIKGCETERPGQRACFMDATRVIYENLTARDLCGLRAGFWIAARFGGGPQKGGLPRALTHLPAKEIRR